MSLDSMLTSPEQLESLDLIRRKGIRVAIDDVITLLAISDVAADAVKLGRGLVSRLPTDEQALKDASEIVKAAKLPGQTSPALSTAEPQAWRRR